MQSRTPRTPTSPARRARAFARVACVAAVALASAAVWACIDDTADPEAPVDTNPGEVDRNAARCPEAGPPDGGACELPEGTTCAFGSCATTIATCRNAVWTYAANAAPRPACPKDLPDLDSLCPPCWPRDLSCFYGSEDCSSADASVSRALASCVTGLDGVVKWLVTIQPCRDAGPDVQGDSGPDAD